MWNDAGAPPNSTGVPGRTSCMMVRPLSTSAVCSTSAPIGLAGEIMPSSSTGTISTGTPHSAQSIMLQSGSSPHWSGVFGQQVKIAIGLALRSSRSDRKRLITSAMRGTPDAVNAPDTTGRREKLRARYSRQASAMSCGTSVGMKAVER